MRRAPMGDYMGQDASSPGAVTNPVTKLTTKPTTALKAVSCIFCKHFFHPGTAQWRGGAKCAAFPDGIPHPILLGHRDHRKPYPGDNGIQFEPLQQIEANLREA